ncbi:MKI67 FHA domain-interacting nucleolar phosphoprotein [Lunasporangiospora selenospora]|uniref:MKI67 FHA domain-interacting nucleolar phosphoprotein n=1 Tax=Lunasporangiospora selenospora TaxID=979761 RepID=A0A9P6G1C1_9FUNG|nr:MKI67 FHA domain-interacting nucleolar phosphoprotein [Lunasporangiospora selenospora]
MVSLAASAPQRQSLRRKAAAPNTKVNETSKKAAPKSTPAKSAVSVNKPASGKSNTKKRSNDDESEEEEEEEEVIELEEEEEEENQEDDSPLMDDSALLKGIDSSAEEDSSDDENEDDKAAMREDTFASMNDEISLDPKSAATVRKRMDALKPTKDQEVTGVVYLGRIPHGFYEEQMKAYFSQFGKVSRLRLSRNKRTGKSKHYAFIEFASQDVAQIVADTMNNYLLFGHLLKCKVLQPEQVHPTLFLGANRKFNVIPFLKIEKERHNAEKSPKQLKSLKRKLLQRESVKRTKLADLGIDYDFPGYKAQEPEKPKHSRFE